LSKTIQHLDKALLNVELIREPAPSFQELQLAAILVRVLLEFLRGKSLSCVSSSDANLLPEAERPSPEVSAGYFSDAPSLVERLMRILLVALDTADFAIVSKDIYATILEASLHSRAMWEAFINYPDAQRVHRVLLLAQPDHAIRHGVAQKIASICGGDLPSTCPVTKAETAARFWVLLSAVLPETIQFPWQSRQFFEITEHIFRTNDEYDRNEESLRSSLTHWGTLLLDHDHQVFPGREEADHVVFGLTKLLLGCIVSLKSFKKPINAGSMMAQVFKKYLFVSRYVTFHYEFS
jgi:ubiquitin carboxyl-terminal hydrolase 34